MKHARPGLLLVSTALVVFLLGGGVALKVGAGDDSYRQVVLFSEVLSLVTDNYVDPVDAETLLSSAYEGMLAGLDANGAYLTPEEVKAWKSAGELAQAHPGIGVLKAGRSLQIVAVEPGSPAEQAHIRVGDQIRSIDGRLVRDLSLKQAWSLIAGRPGTTVKLDVLRATEGFEREEAEVRREAGFGRPYDLEVQRGIGVLHVRDVPRLPLDAVARELAELRTRGVEKLMVDLRNVADLEPRKAVDAGSLFAAGTLLQLRDRSGRLIESLESHRDTPVWTGPIAVLVNGATAGSAEALATVIRTERGAAVVGEPTYGLGAEAKLFELENGSGLVVSSALWETSAGRRWNSDGIEPDEVIHGRGNDFESLVADQLQRALEWFEKRDPATANAEGKKAAA